MSNPWGERFGFCRNAMCVNGSFSSWWKTVRMWPRASAFEPTRVPAYGKDITRDTHKMKCSNQNSYELHILILWLYLGLFGNDWAHQVIIIYEDLKMNKQGAASKRKQVTLMILQKLETIWRLKSGESQRGVTASYNIGSSPIYEIMKQKDQLHFLWN